MQQILHQFAGRKAHPVIQFIKYVIAGGIVTVFSMLVFAFLTWKVFPSLQENELIVRFLHLHVDPMDEALRARNFAYCKIVEFILATLVCYFINIAWVFEPGRHSRHKEIMLFYAVSLISFAVGTALGTGLIAFFNAGTVTAYILNMIAAVLINYTGRKYYVFKE